MRFGSYDGLRRHANKHAHEMCHPKELAGPLQCYRDRLERVRTDLAYWFVGRKNPGFRVVRMSVQRPAHPSLRTTYIIEVLYDETERMRLVLRSLPEGKGGLAVVSFYRCGGPE